MWPGPGLIRARSAAAPQPRAPRARWFSCSAPTHLRTEVGLGPLRREHVWQRQRSWGIQMICKHHRWSINGVPLKTAAWCKAHLLAEMVKKIISPFVFWIVRWDHQDNCSCWWMPSFFSYYKTLEIQECFVWQQVNSLLFFVGSFTLWCRSITFWIPSTIKMYFNME